MSTSSSVPGRFSAITSSRRAKTVVAASVAGSSGSSSQVELGARARRAPAGGEHRLVDERERRLAGEQRLDTLGARRS